MKIDQLQEELKSAQLARDEIKVSTLRLLISEINNGKIAKGHELSDEEILEVVGREAKKRREAAAGFRSGNREDSALKEEAELKILESYLPTQVSDEELTRLVEQAISEACQLALVTGSEKPSLQDMGKIIRLVMERVKGQADGGRVSELVKARLSR